MMVKGNPDIASRWWSLLRSRMAAMQRREDHHRIFRGKSPFGWWFGKGFQRRLACPLRKDDTHKSRSLISV